MRQTSFLSTPFLHVLAYSTVAWTQATQTVMVGNFFDPPIVAARNGDSVEFIFTANPHGVVQSTFDDPCSPLVGGFSSGIVIGTLANETNSSPNWTLTITNDSSPIWFHCPALRPSFHCAMAVVGAINAPPDQFTSFSIAAKAVTTSPTTEPTVSLTGKGAEAATSPTALQLIPTSVTDTPSTPTATNDAANIASPTSAVKSGNTVAIGAGVGGGVGGCIILALIYMLYKSNRDNVQQKSYSSETINKPEIIEKFEKRHSRQIRAMPEYGTTASGTSSPGSCQYSTNSTVSDNPIQPQYVVQNHTINIQEVAKEVATFLQPQLSQTSARFEKPSKGPEISRPLPNTPDILVLPSSPGPPQYERV